MACPRCHGDNPAEARFCSQCGEQLTGVVVCPACGAANASSHRFCHQCRRPTSAADHTAATPGGGVPGRDPALDPRAGAQRAGAGERRFLTAMFCDLVDSTALAEALDPEDLHEVFQSYHERCTQAVARYEGHVAKYLGDGLLVYFGYPQAHEDDAQRAVRAALDIIAGLAGLNDELGASRGIRLAVRMGIHSGEVVFGESGVAGLREQQAAGHSLHLAARLQAVASPDTVVVSDTTLRLLRGMFVIEDLGAQALKGIAEPVKAYRVRGASGAQSRLDAASVTGLTPLIGREAELEMLLACWERARAGQGQTMVVSGEAGIGKSRLVRVLRERLADTTHLWLEARCTPYAQQSALYPIIELQQRALRFTDGDAADAKLAKLERALASADIELPEVVPLLATFHSLPIPARYPPLNLSPEGQRRKTLEALSEWLLQLGRQQPVVLVVEDLHWVDPSTVELLGRLVERISATKVLAVYTHRPEFRLPWDPRATVVALSPLTDAEVQQMVAAAAGHTDLPAARVREIIDKTEGIPLFVEEFTKSVAEVVRAGGRDAGRPSAARVATPATLQELLATRLDRLGGAKDLAELCAVAGREFSLELIRSASQLPDSALQEGLDRLLLADVLVQSGDRPRDAYQFKHALIQEAAYRSLLKPKRQHHHHRVGEALEREFPAVAEAQPELLAHHFSEAGLTERAMTQWLQAGQRAIVRSANVEAISHLGRCLEMIDRLADSPERLQLELTARGLLGLGLIATRGHGAAEVESNFARARELCRQLGETPHIFPVLMGLWLFYLVRSDNRTTGELAQQLLRFAENVGDPALVLEAHGAMACTAYWRGDHIAVREHAAGTLAIYDPAQHGDHSFLYGQDPAVFAHIHTGLSAWFLGYPDQAVQSVKKGIAMAESIAIPFTLAGALSLGCDLRYRRREAAEDRALGERLLALASEQGFALWIGGAMTTLAWSLVEQGRVDDGIAQLRDSLDRVAATGANINGPYVLSKLVEAYRIAGRPEPGLRTVDEALSKSQRALDRYWEAELHRQKGELLLLAGRGAAAAEPCFQQALDVARAQGAKSLELRATMSLSRLWRQHGGVRRSYQLLNPIYAWFTEGFDTRDLQDAKLLLDQLRAECHASVGP